MEFRIPKETFYRALQKIQGIVEKRTTMPILSNALIEAREGGIEVIATDLDVAMKSSYAATTIHPGKITVAAKKLCEILKELPDEEVHFCTRDNDWVDIRCGKAQFNLVGLSPDEFPLPRIREDNLITLRSSLIGEMIEKTSYAICTDETKYNLNGVFVQARTEGDRNLIKMVATDGHRLALVSRTIEGEVGPELCKGVIFPRKGIYELKKMAEEESGEMMIGFMDNSAVIKKGDTVVVMRLVDGEFPDYNRVIPQQNNRSVKINRDNFLHTLRRMQILSSDKFKGIKLNVSESGVEISSSNPELGDSREEMEVLFEGEPLALRFNARYLIDVLTVLDGNQVELLLRDELSPAIIRSDVDPEFLAVIMPMRV
jgi:DNA polymerase III subunit beta